MAGSHWRVGLALALHIAFIGVFFGGACVSSTFADGSFSCDPMTAPACPPDLTCGSDKRCHTPSSLPSDDGGPSARDGGSFCAREAHALCQDFDQGTLGTFAMEGTGELSVDDAASLSPPYSLRAALPGANGARTARITAPLPTRAAHVLCRFSLRIEAYEAESTTDLLLVSLGAEGADISRYDVSLTMNAQKRGFFVEELGSRADGGVINAAHEYAPLPSLATWTTAQLEASASPAGGSASLRIGGINYGPWKLAATEAQFSSFSVGIVSSGKVNTATVIRFDDLGCDPQ